MGGSRAATEGRGGAQAAGGDAGGGAAAAGGAAQAAGRNGGGAQAAGAEVLLVQAADARGLQRHTRRTQQPVVLAGAPLSLPFPPSLPSPGPLCFRSACTRRRRRNRTAAPKRRWACALPGPAGLLLDFAAPCGACVLTPRPGPFCRLAAAVTRI